MTAPMPRVRTVVTSSHSIAVIHRLIQPEDPAGDWVLLVEVSQLDPCDPTREQQTSTMEGAWGE